VGSWRADDRLRGGIARRAGQRATRSPKCPGLLVCTGLIGDCRACGHDDQRRIEQPLALEAIDHALQRQVGLIRHRPARRWASPIRPCSRPAAVEARIDRPRRSCRRSCPWPALTTLTAWKFMPKIAGTPVTWSRRDCAPGSGSRWRQLLLVVLWPCTHAGSRVESVDVGDLGCVKVRDTLARWPIDQIVGRVLVGPRGLSAGRARDSKIVLLLMKCGGRRARTARARRGGAAACRDR